MIRLGTCVDGRTLYYDATLYEFRLERALVTYADVRGLDDHAHIAWCAPEQRDWFRKIDQRNLDRCNRRALGRHGNGYEGLSPEEQVQADAKRNDSVLAGKIVDADPALVRAVADALEAEGLVGRAAAGSPQMVVGLPQGMEALGQLEGQQGRKMTLMEHYLMRQILKNDDKAKSKREKGEKAREAREQAEAQKEARDLENTRNIARAQKRVMNVDAREAQSIKRRSDERARAAASYRGAVNDNVDDDSIDAALARAEASSAARFRAQPNVEDDDEFSTGAYGRTTVGPGRAPRRVEYTDSYGRPIRPEADAMRPDRSQVAYVASEEEKALAEMRARNLAQQSYYETTATNVPGMEVAGGGNGKRRRGINDGASINGHQVNADGTPKETKFTKFMGGLGKFNEAISPLIGGGGPGGGGGHGGGGGMSGGGGGAGGGMGGMGGAGGMGGMGGGMGH